MRARAPRVLRQGSGPRWEPREHRRAEDRRRQHRHRRRHRRKERSRPRAQMPEQASWSQSREKQTPLQVRSLAAGASQIRLSRIFPTERTWMCPSRRLLLKRQGGGPRRSALPTRRRNPARRRASPQMPSYPQTWARRDQMRQPRRWGQSVVSVPSQAPQRVRQGPPPVRATARLEKAPHDEERQGHPRPQRRS